MEIAYIREINGFFFNDLVSCSYLTSEQELKWCSTTTSAINTVVMDVIVAIYWIKTSGLTYF